MTNCRDIIRLYDEFKANKPVGDINDPIKNVKILKQIIRTGSGMAVKAGLQQGITATLGSAAVQSVAGRVALGVPGVIIGVFTPNDSMKSGVDYFYATLKSIIIDLDADSPDYSGAFKKISKLRDTITTIQVEERAEAKGNSNCFQCLIDIADDIEKLCTTKGQSFKAG